MNTRMHGFTILELMFALTNMGMLLMLGMLSFTTFLRNSEVRSTAESISNGLRAARSEATRLNRPVSFTLATGTDPQLDDQHLQPVIRSADLASDISNRASKSAGTRRWPACPRLPYS